MPGQTRYSSGFWWTLLQCRAKAHITPKVWRLAPLAEPRVVVDEDVTV
jgi:hypothetical protein